MEIMLLIGVDDLLLLVFDMIVLYVKVVVEWVVC